MYRSKNAKTPQAIARMHSFNSQYREMSTYAHFSDLTASDPLHVSLKADSFTNKDLKTKLLKDV